MCVFVFKQKTAYEIEYGLVGSDMCIRDSFAAEAGHGVDDAFLQVIEFLEELGIEGRVEAQQLSLIHI